MALCDRCGEKIAVANDLDQAGDIDQRRRVVMVAGVPRRLAPKQWRLSVLLYCNRGNAVDSDWAYDALYGTVRNPPRLLVIRAHIGHLRRALEGSRYQIVSYLGVGYELVVSGFAVA